MPGLEIHYEAGGRWVGAGFKLSEYYLRHAEWRRDGPHLPLSVDP